MYLEAAIPAIVIAPLSDGLIVVQVVSYLQLLSGPLRPSVWGGVFSCSAETVRRCRTIVVDEEEREQKASHQ